MRAIIDVPSGWRFGFPKELPEGVTDLRQWLIDNNYPKNDVDFAMTYCRMWYEEENEEK